MIRELRKLEEAHRDDFVGTGETNWASMCHDVATRLEELLAAQTPRVMTLEEVRQFVYGSPYIIETNLPGDEPRLMWGLYSHQGVSGNFDFAITDGRKRLFDADYGKTWRCWTQRPTKEQREAEPWL